MKQITRKIAQFIMNYLHFFILSIAQLIALQISAQQSTIKDYLAANSQPIVIDSTNPFTIFDKAFYDNQIFLSSESHGYAKPHAIDFELFKHINQKTGVKYYIAEMDMAQAKAINDYLKTGNETYLNSIYNYWYNDMAQWGCKAGFNKWKKIYAYNKTLAKAKKITVLGLDNTQDLEMTLNYIIEIIKSNTYKNGRAPYIDSAMQFIGKALNKDTTKAFIKFIRRWDIDIENNSTVYKKLIAKSYFEWRFMISNTAAKKDRESKITANFKTLVTEYKLSKEKFYGFWGRFHAMQDSINGDLSFSARLKSSFKIISIPIFCIESASMIPTSYLPAMAAQKGTVYSKVDMVNDDSFIYKVNGIADFKNATPANGITIFKLNAANSPFAKGLTLVNSKSDFDKTFNWNGSQQSHTLNYMQYAIMARGSTWAEPFGDNVAK
jgi:hypothetical protein